MKARFACMLFVILAKLSEGHGKYIYLNYCRKSNFACLLFT